MIQKAKQHINLHFADQDISAFGGINRPCEPESFQHDFSQETGETFIEYLTGVGSINQKSCC